MAYKVLAKKERCARIALRDKKPDKDPNILARF